MQGWQCYYCGMVGEQTDHWPALSIEHTLPPGTGLRIKSCAHCNWVLRDTHQPTLEERKRYAQALKHKSKLKQPRLETVEEKLRYERMEATITALARPDLEHADDLIDQLKGEKK